MTNKDSGSNPPAAEAARSGDKASRKKAGVQGFVRSNALYTSLVLLFLGITACTSVIPLAWNATATAPEDLAALRQKAECTAVSLAAYAAALTDESSDGGVSAVLGELRRKDPDLRKLLVFDSSGLILHASAPELVGQPASDYFAMLGGLAVKDETSKAQRLLVHAPMIAGGSLAGGVGLEVSTAFVEQRNASRTWAALLGVFLAASVAAALLWPICRGYRVAIERVKGTLDKLAAGNYASRTGMSVRNEVQVVASATDALGCALAAETVKHREQIEALEKRIATRTQALEESARRIEELQNQSPANAR